MNVQPALTPPAQPPRAWRWPRPSDAREDRFRCSVGTWVGQHLSGEGAGISATCALEVHGDRSRGKNLYRKQIPQLRAALHAADSASARRHVIDAVERRACAFGIDSTSVMPPAGSDGCGRKATSRAPESMRPAATTCPNLS